MVHNRFLFIAGLHRTGTSLLARLIGAHPQVSSISGAPVPENEGCYLQGAIPHTAQHGRPGHFATDPAQHHVEGSPYDSLEVKQRILADWSAWFDKEKPWWLEKSPVNLTRMRLYQQLFPTCQFIVILRHPQAMAAALAKWVETPADELVRHGLAAYRQMAADLPYLHSVMVVRYEDLVRCPAHVLGASCAFMGIEEIDPHIAIRDGNEDYDTRANAVDPETAAQMEHWGYLPGGKIAPWTPIVAHPLRERSERTSLLLAKNALPPADSESGDAKKNKKLTSVNRPNFDELLKQ